jgi:hypothetical protein
MLALLWGIPWVIVAIPLALSIFGLPLARKCMEIAAWPTEHHINHKLEKSYRYRDRKIVVVRKNEQAVRMQFKEALDALQAEPIQSSFKATGNEKFDWDRGDEARYDIPEKEKPWET